jgi:hypothetical protein
VLLGIRRTASTGLFGVRSHSGLPLGCAADGAGDAGGDEHHLVTMGIETPVVRVAHEYLRACMDHLTSSAVQHNVPSLCSLKVIYHIHIFCQALL